MKIINLFILTVFCFDGFSQDSTVYDFRADSIANSRTINFSHFQDKKILIVNTATLDINSSQLIELNRLQNSHANNLVVVIFPSNDFNSEPGNNMSISNFLSGLNLSLTVGGKITVQGNGIHPLYYWLTHQSLSGVSDLKVKAPFQKYLIDESGRLVKMFNAQTKPMSQAIINAITE